jgi:uncharacterized membrane protein
MTTAAFGLVIASAFAHAGWNFLLKQSGHKLVFIWSLGLVAAAILLIPAVAFAAADGIDARGLLFGVVSGLIHGFYGLALARAYHLGDLSTVYPVSRGMGPALVPIFAVLLLDERVSPLAGSGIALVVIGVGTLHMNERLWRDLRQPARALSSRATQLALVTGALIAAYSLWDKAALHHLPPVTLNGFSMAGHFLVLTPLAALSGTSAIGAEWRRGGRHILTAAVLSALAYTLVLLALTTSRVSYVAPVREVGIVLGAWMGVVFLGEGYGSARLLGSALIVAGVLMLAVAP